VLWTREFETTQAVPNAQGQAEDKTINLPTTKTILQGLKVLRVINLKAGGATTKSGSSSSGVNSNASLQSGTKGDTGSNGQAAATAAQQALYNDTENGQSDPMYSAAAVLGITDQQAEVLKYAREYGKISLTLRAKDDTDQEKTTGITDKILV